MIWHGEFQARTENECEIATENAIDRVIHHPELVRLGRCNIAASGCIEKCLLDVRGERDE